MDRAFDIAGQTAFRDEKHTFSDQKRLDEMVSRKEYELIQQSFRLQQSLKKAKEEKDTWCGR